MTIPFGAQPPQRLHLARSIKRVQMTDFAPNSIIRLVSLLGVATAIAGGIAVADPLPALNLNPEETTVSGLSSGAFMAVQLQVAFSNNIKGAGVIAGGPFNCADQSLRRALFVCMTPALSKADAGKSVAKMRDMAERGEIAPLSGVASDRLYLFHGKGDKTVARATMDALHETYLELNVKPEDIKYVTSVEAGHGFVTEQGSVACADTQPNFLNDCDFDQAGDIFNWLYQGLKEPIEPKKNGLLSFDQALYSGDAAGMDTKAFVYVPADCAGDEECRLHIAFHGCKQGRETLDEDYARLTGYNRWAEANRIVVLYPQAATVPAPWHNQFAGNPNGCWDWWGYSAKDYLSREAPQLAAIEEMAQALGAPLADE